MDYEFESNLDVFNPTATTNGIYGWVPMDTIQVTSSGFLGSSFAPGSTSGALPIFNSQLDEVDLANQGPGLSNSGPATLLIYNCPSQ
jgi:hypothetical protein